MDYGKPAHAEGLLRELESSSDVRATLLRHLDMLPADNSLMSAYLRLSFNPEASDFLVTPTRPQAIATIKNEYEIRAGVFSSSPEATSPGYLKDVDSDLKINFMKTYQDLGLGPFGGPPEFEPGPEYYLTDLWGGYGTPNPKTDLAPAKLETLQTGSTRHSYLATPTSWVSNVESVEEEDLSSSIRGLKRLSTMVKSVVSSRISIPHKEVVTRILQEVIKTSGVLKDKEEKNIKRRLYDSINVLLAVGAIVKDGRNLIWKGDLESQLRKKRKLDEATVTKTEKENKLREIVGKYLAIKQLMHRNLSLNLQYGIRFPFILTATPDTPDNSVLITLDFHSGQPRGY